MASKDFALSSKKVLIVDDEVDARIFTKQLLDYYYTDVFTAASAAQGLEQVCKHMPNVIISDIAMPEMDGYQFLREIRNLPAHKGGLIPAIALTALTQPENKRKAISAGFQRHLEKPIDLQILVEAIGSVMK